MWQWCAGRLGQGAGVLALTGILVLGACVTATPAHAESIRASQWHLDAMKADGMWKTSTGEGVTVAVIDTGVDGSHPDLQGQVLEGKDFSFKSGGDTSDPNGHGTSMAALIAGSGKGRNGEGGFGLAPGAKILPLRVWADPKVKSTDDKGATEIAQALRYAADSDARVINVSLGTYQGREELTDAVDYAVSKGKLIFSASGNQGAYDAPLGYPAEIPGVVAVSAIGKDGKAIKDSQHGPEIDLAAPGKDIVHACGDSGTGYCRTHGTSDACALASASAALIWSKHPDWTANQVLRVMINTAGALTDGSERNDYVGYGAVRPRVALTTPGDPGPADVSPLPEVAAAESAGSAESAKPGAPDAEPSGEGKNGSQAVADDADDGGGSGLWIGLGIGGAVLVAGAVTVMLLRRNRRAF